MQSGGITFFEVSQHELLTGFYLEGELEISEDWIETSGVFLSEAVIVVNKGDKEDFYCGCSNGEKTSCQENADTANRFKLPALNDNIKGAYSLSHRFGVVVLDYIAIKKDVRKNGIGSALLHRIKEKCGELRVEKIYLTAKARDFFLKNGAKEVAAGFPLYSELLGECAECQQRGKECFPAVMEIEIN